jgi:type IV pilus assembly protein PilV
MSRHRLHRARRGQLGFTLIEVMVAILVLGVGLLGFAMLQTMNVRFTKSAQQRTVATALAYEVIDMMRIQRSDAGLGAYNQITFGSFGSVVPGSCARPAAASTSANITRWKCEVRTALPDGVAQVVLGANGEVTVDVRWGDAHWSEDAADVNTTFQLVTRL